MGCAPYKGYSIGYVNPDDDYIMQDKHSRPWYNQPGGLIIRKEF